MDKQTEREIDSEIARRIQHLGDDEGTAIQDVADEYGLTVQEVTKAWDEWNQLPREKWD